MVRFSFGHISLSASGSFIKYSRIIVAGLRDSINICVIILEVLITRMYKYLFP